MPISGPVLGQQIYGMMALSTLSGSQTFPLAQAIGNGIANSILATGVYQGASTGLGLGVGVSVGFLTGGIVMPSIVSNLILVNMTAQGLVGSHTLNLANAIGNAVSAHMLTAVVQGASTVVAAGAGVGSIIGVIGPVLGMSISLQMLASGLTGTAVTQLSQAIGMGVAAALSATVVNTVITGVPVGPIPPVFPPIPCVGTDTGKLF